MLRALRFKVRQWGFNLASASQIFFMMEIEFIWHDCFLIKTPAANYVFDYWLDSDGNDRVVPGFIESLDRKVPLMVFISHGHKDHFNKSVFEWSVMFENIHYIVSNDVGKRIRHITSETSVYSGTKVAPSMLTIMKAGESLVLPHAVVRSFPSTDIGNCYLVETSAGRIFHAGDLNAWIWLDESDDKEVRKALGDYNACLRDISDYIFSPEGRNRVPDGHIDLCFFPVDSRIGRDYFTGAGIFVRKFDVRHFFPMHFDLGDDAERLSRRKDALNFNSYANFDRGEYIPLAINGTYCIIES